MSKIIVIRGATGAGKSSVANYLHSNLMDMTVLLPQDVFKIDMAQDNPALNQAVLNSLETTAQEFSAIGATVLIEGVLSKKHWHDMVDRLGDGNELYAFFLKTDLDTSIARARERQKSAIITDDIVREYHPKCIPMGVSYEVVLDANSKSVQELSQEIVAICGLTLAASKTKTRLYSNSFHPEK